MRLFGVPPDLSGADIDTWFISPPGMLCSHRMERFEATHAAEVERVAERMMARFPETTQYVFVHDFSRMGNYTSDGRVRFTELGLQYFRKKRIESVHLVMPPMHSLIRMGIQTAVMSLRVAGIKIDVSSSLETVIAKVGLSHASGGCAPSVTVRVPKSLR